MLGWGPDGALYVLDFGVVNTTAQGMNAWPNSGALFRVTRTSAPREPIPIRRDVPRALLWGSGKRQGHA